MKLPRRCIETWPMSACVVLTVSLAFQQYYDLLFLSFPFAVNVTGLSKFVGHFLLHVQFFYLEFLYVPSKVLFFYRGPTESAWGTKVSRCTHWWRNAPMRGSCVLPGLTESCCRLRKTYPKPWYLGATKLNVPKFPFHVSGHM